MLIDYNKHAEIINACKLKEALPRYTVHKCLASNDEVQIHFLDVADDAIDFEVLYVVELRTGNIWYFFDDMSNHPCIVKHSVNGSVLKIEVVTLDGDTHSWFKWATEEIDKTLGDLFDHTYAYYRTIIEVWANSNVIQSVDISCQ